MKRCHRRPITAAGPRRSLLRRPAWLVAGLLVLATTGTAVAQSADAAGFADRLATLRAEVEELASELEMKKEDQRTRLRALATQRTDAELQIQREERRLLELRAAAEKQKERVSAEDAATQDLRPAVERSITTLRAAIAGGLPFKQDARLAELDTLEQGLQSGMLSPQKAASRLWQLAEDELRLSRENGLYRQTVTIDGEEMLVDVARLGMVAMYFRTSDGRVGHAARRDDGWTYAFERGEQDVEQIHGLFDSLKKQIRTGYFVLPNALPKAVSQDQGEAK